MMVRIPFQNVLVWNLKTTIRWQHFLYSIVVFAFIGMSSSLYINGVLSNLEKNLWNSVFVAFAGTGIWSISIVEMLRWFAPYLLFFYLMGDLVEGELSLRGYAIIPAIGSRVEWWLGKVVTLLIFVGGYCLLGIGVVILISSFMLPWSMHVSPFLSEFWQYPEILTVCKLILWIIFLFSSTLFAMALLQITVSIWVRKPFLTFALVSIIMILSWLVGIENPETVRWLPGSQPMLLRHTEFESSVPNFPFAWSVIYNLTITLLVFLGNLLCISGLDISVPKTDIRMEEKR